MGPGDGGSTRLAVHSGTDIDLKCESKHAGQAAVDVDLGSRNAEAVSRRWPDGSHARWLLFPAAVAALGGKKQATSCLPRTRTLPVNQSRRFGAVMDSAMDLSLSSSGRSPHRFPQEGGPETMQLPLGHHLPRGGASPAAHRRSMRVLVSHAVPIAQPLGYDARLDATDEEGSRAVPREAPVSHGLLAGGPDAAAIDGP